MKVAQTVVEFEAALQELGDRRAYVKARIDMSASYQGSALSEHIAGIVDQYHIENETGNLKLFSLKMIATGLEKSIGETLEELNTQERRRIKLESVNAKQAAAIKRKLLTRTDTAMMDLFAAHSTRPISKRHK